MVLGALSCINASINRLEFIAEELNFGLDSKHLSVDGYYHFYNPHSVDVEQLIYYPIIADSLSGSYSQLQTSLVEAIPGVELNVLDIKPNGFWFSLLLPSKSLCTYRIRYKQEVKNRRAIYILRSTATWGKPLSKAKYRLSLARNIQLKKEPLPNPKIKKGWFNTEYYWEFYDFLPKTDFELIF